MSMLKSIKWVLVPLLVVAVFSILVVGAAAQTTEIKKVPIQKTPASSGSEMFKSYCASCHGLDGKGKGPATPALKVAPGDLTVITKSNGGKFPELRVLNAITGDSNLAAHGSKDMPVWGELFRELAAGSTGEQQLRLRNLTKYIESIQVK